MKKGRGRPRKSLEGRFFRLDIRLTSEEKVLIQNLAKDKGITITDLILNSLGL